MRITIVGPTAPLRGGIVAHTEGASRALARCSHAVDVRGFSRLYPRWVGGDRPGSGLGVVRREGTIDALAPRTWRAVASDIATDLLLVEYWTPLLAPALRAILVRSSARRRILVCHNARPHESVTGARLLLASLLRHADGVIVHSEAMRVALDGIAKRSFDTAVVPMPLLVSSTGPLLRPPELERLGGSEKLVVVAGHIRRYKGLDVLEQAWRYVRRKNDARLVVAGEPIGTRRELVALSTSGDVTVLERYLDDAELRWLFAHAGCAVFAYTAASQSGLLPLALRLARHVVVSDAGGLAEQLGDGDAGVSIVPAGDVAALASAIEASLVEAAVVSPFAVRQATSKPASDEVAASWQPFVAAVECLAGGAIVETVGSNRKDSRPSVVAKRSGREAPPRAWYDAGPSATAGTETRRT